MKKTLLLLSSIALLAVMSARGLDQFSQSTQLTVTTNSPVLITTPFVVNVPSISLTITATNAATIVTNTLFQSLSIGGVVLNYPTTFIYNASTMGTNFTTNFPPYNVYATNYTYGQAAPQSTASNSVSIK
jgi:hypothetical protein